jgi:hypothetical protein
MNAEPTDTCKEFAAGLNFAGQTGIKVKLTLGQEHLFQPGNTEGKGRIPGRPNRRTFELQQRLKERGDVDPADFCSSIVSSDKESTELKLAAANYLLPYLYSKRGAMPPPRYIELEVDVNEFQHVSDAENFLAKIALLVARGHLDIQSGQELSALVKAWIDTQYAKDELQFKINPPEQRDTTIRVEGGLPALPGTTITMPVLNGHAVSEQLLTAPNDVVPANDGTNPVQEDMPKEFSTPGEAKAIGPHPLQERHFASAEEPRKNSGNGGEH